MSERTRELRHRLLASWPNLTRVTSFQNGAHHAESFTFSVVVARRDATNNNRAAVATQATPNAKSVAQIRRAPWPSWPS